jgi:hypothetical protein
MKKQHAKIIVICLFPDGEYDSYSFVREYPMDIGHIPSLHQLDFEKDCLKNMFEKFNISPDEWTKLPEIFIDKLTHIVPFTYRNVKLQEGHKNEKQ